jgi:hypothetical protein
VVLVYFRLKEHTLPASTKKPQVHKVITIWVLAPSQEKRTAATGEHTLDQTVTTATTRLKHKSKLSSQHQFQRTKYHPGNKTTKGLFVWAVAGWLCRESCCAEKAAVQGKLLF